MSVESFQPGADSVQVTARAEQHFREQLKGSPAALGVRLGLQESGCTGYMYVVELVEDEAAVQNDLRLDLADDLRLFVDRQHLALLNGTQVDFVRTGVNYQLAFNNPHARDHCGCGESFNLESA